MLLALVGVGCGGVGVNQGGDAMDGGGGRRSGSLPVKSCRTNDKCCAVRAWNNANIECCSIQENWDWKDGASAAELETQDGGVGVEDGGGGGGGG